jgi:hypothetical protein
LPVEVKELGNENKAKNHSALTDSLTAAAWRKRMWMSYARVPTTKQNFDLQRDAKNRPEREKVVEEKFNGDSPHRPGLEVAGRRIIQAGANAAQEEMPHQTIRRRRQVSS